MSKIAPKIFATRVLTWQKHHGRHDLPWQNPPTPYRVLVSEIMLQQTQVTTVIPYFERWMARFPTLEHLANATEDEVMALWQGLGYYSRARNLHKAARFIIGEHQGKFPTELADIQKIPGVGRYTAGAIRSFAFDAYGPIVDGNVRRLFCRFFGIEGIPSTAAVNNQLWQLAEDYTPATDNRRFAQGLLDLGATCCTPRAPNCKECPLHESCYALKTQQIDQLPTPKQKQVTPVRPGHFLWSGNQHSIFLQKRPERGIWASLWCLPEVQSPPTDATLVGEFEHTFSHYKLIAKVWREKTQQVNESQEGTHVSYNELSAFGLPAPIRKFIQAQRQIPNHT